MQYTQALDLCIFHHLNVNDSFESGINKKKGLRMQICTHTQIFHSDLIDSYS